MAQLYILKYSFLFDNNSPFAHLWEFEKLFTEFLNSKNLEAQLIKAVEGSQSERIMVISRKSQIPIAEPSKNPVGRPQTLKGKIKDLSDRKFRKPAIEFMKGKK